MTDRHELIVVGAGSAGCVVAARLAGPAGHAGDRGDGATVLLLEAGPDDAAPGVAAGNFLAALAEPTRIWSDVVASRVAGGPTTPYLRGRGVGGSSAVNALIGLWGTSDDDASWAAAGGARWRSAELRRLRGRVARRLPLWRPPLAAWSPFERLLADAARAAGYPWCPDQNQPGSWGVGPAPLTVRDGRRWSVVDAYLAPALAEGQLKVEAGVTVDRVLFEGRRAVGVRTADGQERLASGGVVVACGALHSPALLLRSGLTSTGLGQNLADHASAGFSLALEPGARLADPSRRPLSSLVRYSSGLPGTGPRDMELLPLGATAASREGLAVGSLQVAVMAPFSRGAVTLASDDPLEPPRVELRLLSDRRDLVRLRDGLRRIRELLAAPQLARAVSAVFVDAEGTPVETLDAEGALDAWLGGGVGQYVHATGTCRMGRPDDPAAVVDPEGRVIGREALWVADASVLPTPPRAGTHLSAVLVGELVGESLLRERREA